jgi:hypothetical protein
MWLTAPAINDISSDLTNPPRFLVGPPAELAYDAARFAEATRRGYPELHNLRLALPPQEACARVRALVARRGWRVAAEEAGTGATALRVQAVAITPLLRFRDDVAIEVRVAEGGSEIAMRSRSRLGDGDLGTNAARIRAFFAALAVEE